MIVVFGSINVDLVARVPAIPRPGETVLSPGYEVLFGGKGANQAVAAARALSGSGMAVGMVGRVGDDEYGRAALANLRDNGVETGRVATGPEPTGCAFIVVDDAGENAITVASGANMVLRADDLDLGLGPGDVLVLQMEAPFAETLKVAQTARASGTTVIWNYAPAIRCSRPDLVSLIGATSILVVNEHEARAAAECLGTRTTGTEAAASAISRDGAAIVILTSGPEGATAFRAGIGTVHAPAPKVDVVDTTGAGDTFVGVLAATLAQQIDLQGSVERACAAASAACMQAGAQAGMPNGEEIQALLSRQAR